MNVAVLARFAPSRWPIATKLSTTLLAVALLPMGLTTYFNLRESITDVEAAAYANVELLATGQSAQLDQLILDHRRIVEYLAMDPLLVEFLTAAASDRPPLQPAVDRQLLRLQDLDPSYDLVYLLDAQGKGVAAPAFPPAIGDDLRFREYFQVPQRTGESYVSSILVGTNTQAPGMYFAAPVQSEQGDFLGVAVIKLDGELIWRIVDALGDPESPEQGVFLIDQAGIVIAHPNREWLYHSLGELEPAVANQVRRDRRYGGNEIPSLGLETLASTIVGTETSGYVKYELGSPAQSRITGYAPLAQQDWVLGISQPESTLVAALQGLAVRSYLALGISAVGAAGLSIILIRTIVRPIRDLTLAATKARVEQGQLHFATSDRQDELGTLTRAFYHMEQRLHGSFQALEESKDLLAERVEERTAELTHALAQLRQTQAQIVQQEKLSSLGELVAGIAHEINNPVNFIHGNVTHAQNYLEDLLGLVALYQQHYPEPVAEIEAEIAAIDLEFLEEDLRKLLASMAMGTDRIRQIVLSLRNFARMDEAECKDVDIHEGIDSTLVMLKHRLKATEQRPKIAVVREYGDLPCVECYASQLNQVFMNILVNAIDAVEQAYQQRSPAERAAQPPTITIRTQRLDTQQVEIAIADNGTGIPAEIQTKIFDPFFTTKPVGKGTGMGMSISYQIIIERHGGHLTCTSQPGAGTTFTIQLHRYLPTASAPESVPESVLAPPLEAAATVLSATASS